MPSKMRVVNNELILVNACKTCVGGSTETDLQVIQCNASNVHGYQFVDAYINVLRKLLDCHLCAFLMEVCR